MQSKNILYIADPNSIHDFKWISFFSQKEGFNCFITGEKGTYSNLTSEQKDKLKSSGINLLPSIDDFSISNPLKTLKAILKLRQEIKTHNIDTIHALFGSPQPIWFNFLESNKKLIITNRGSDVLVLIKGLYENKSKPLNSLLYKLIKRGFNKSNYVTCTSNKQIDYLKVDVLKHDSNIELIKTGIDIDRLKKHDLPCEVNLQFNKKVIFSIRYIGEVYNMDYQLQGIKKLSSEVLNSSVFIFVRGFSCGDKLYNNFKNELENIEGLNYQIEHSLNQDEVWSLIKRSDLIYMVPKSDGTPNSALEIMASEKPFIMGNLDYNKELFEDVCLIADLSDPKSLAEKIEEGLIDYPENLIKNGLEKVTKFGSRESEMKKLLKLYKE
jgi:glycosyltransferase involved in cell wall biosynthesis